MKRILFITHTISMGGGAEKVLDTLIRELSSEYHIDILEWLEDTISPFHINTSTVNHIGSIAWTDRKANSLKRNVKINQFKHKLHVLINAFFPKLTYRYHIKNKYDYEISFNYLYTSLLIANSSNKDSKKIMWIHSSLDDLNNETRSLKYRIYRWIQHRAFNKANAIVAISRMTHNSIAKFQPETENKIHDIYNGYDFNEIYSKSEELKIERGNKFRLISIGRLESRKNVALQIGALEFLRNKGINVELFILGIGEQESALKKLSDNNSNIMFIGFKKNPYPYIKSSDCLIITSYNEGFPTVAVEAMALGKPVISTAVAGTEELIQPETGLIVDWNVESVANGILTILKNSYDSEKIKNHVSPYTKQNWINNVKKLLNELDNE